MQTLFDQLPHNGTQTSRAAAATKLTTGTADTDRCRIVTLMLSLGKRGATRDEIGDRLKMDGSSCRPRIYELLGKCHRYLERGGEPALVETGETREYDGHKAAKVLRHRMYV